MCNNNCEDKKIENEPLEFFLDGTIDETDDDVVMVPREEYDELIAEATILRVVEKLISKIRICDARLDAVRDVLELGQADEEDAE